MKARPSTVFRAALLNLIQLPRKVKNRPGLISKSQYKSKFRKDTEGTEEMYLAATASSENTEKGRERMVKS
jgi:hypothetical protein